MDVSIFVKKILSLFEQWSSQFVGSSDNNDQNFSSSVVAANEQTQFNAEHCLSLQTKDQWRLVLIFTNIGDSSHENDIA